MHVRYAYCYVLLQSLYNIKTSNVFDINRSPRSQLRSPGRSNSTYLYTFSTYCFVRAIRVSFNASYLVGSLLL